jgi:hypothetical protein
MVIPVRNTNKTGDTMQIVRTEPTTGGATRTPRERIEPVFTEGQEVESEGYLDCSTSESWEIADTPNAPARWPVQLEVYKQFIIAAESLDSQEQHEQASGSDSHGGTYTYPFSNLFLPIGEGDDDGDLNKNNFDRKMNAFVRKYFDAQGNPQGGTQIMAAIAAADRHFLGEFGPSGENERPRGQRPVRARAVFTDGELRDHDEFAAYMQSDHNGEWNEHWFIAILGHGEEHDSTLKQYQTLAQRHTNLHVYSFDSVSNPAEIAEDVAIAVLAKK